jgi:hypothetical protein
MSAIPPFTACLFCCQGFWSGQDSSMHCVMHLVILLVSLLCQADYDLRYRLVSSAWQQGRVKPVDIEVCPPQI